MTRLVDGDTLALGGGALEIWLVLAMRREERRRMGPVLHLQAVPSSTATLALALWINRENSLEPITVSKVKLLQPRRASLYERAAHRKLLVRNQEPSGPCTRIVHRTGADRPDAVGLGADETGNLWIGT